jgi:hypothetical protein
MPAQFMGHGAKARLSLKVRGDISDSSGFSRAGHLPENDVSPQRIIYNTIRIECVDR